MKKLFLFLLVLSSSLFAEVIEDQSNLTIETPSLSERKVKKLRLDNGLEVLLISDPETPKSGAALAVGVGSWDDPTDRAGMAHFVEHLLFLGTEKYPEEEEYSRYLDEHGGMRNAFTMADRTVFMFSVNNNGFLGALDRFGQFFISPLFNPSGVERECQAIHQEFCKDLPLDPWRALYVKKELSNDKHPFHSFCIGNRDTLAKISQEELKAWYNTYYSPQVMHLVVYSSLDLETLEKEVTPLFNQVKPKAKTWTACQEPLLTSNTSQKMVVISPVQDLQILELTWEIPRFFGREKTLHVHRLISHVLGHEGENSLLAQLKRENLAETLSMGNFRAGHDQCLLSLSIHLTSKGMQEYRTVIERCFEAIASIRQSGIPRFIFEEVCQLEELDYRFQSRQDVFKLVTEYAVRLVDEPLATFPRQSLIPTTYSPQKIHELLDHLTAEHCQYTLIAPPDRTKLKPTNKEKWLGVEYSVVPIAAEKIEQWENSQPHPAISIPRPNPFVPENLWLKKTADSSTKQNIPQPTLLTEESRGMIYTAQDNQFLVPEVCWHFTIKTPEISDADPLTHVFADLYCHTVNEQLNATAYEAQMAGLIYSLKPTHGGLELKIKGYSDKAALFLNRVLQTMKTAKPTPEHFALYFDLLMRDYINSLNVTPLKQGGELVKSILFKDFSGLKEKSEAMENASYHKMLLFCDSLLKQSYIEGMLYGNLTQEEAKSVWEMCKKTLASAPYFPHLHPKLELAYLPQENASYLVMKSQHPANALILTADCGDFSFKRRAAQEILSKGLEEPFFSELRTRQQTAYVVTNWSQELERHLYSFFAIQSSSHDTRDLLSRFELFLESSLQNLTDQVIPKERFEAIKAAQIYQLEHPAETLSKMGSLLHTLAFKYDGDFEWLEKRKEAFHDLSYEEFVDFAHEFLGKESPRRLAVCVNGALPHKGKLSYKKMTTPAKIRSEICYKGRDWAH